ncbi:MAG: alpha-galactosidase [Armatimonadota bacterium]
MKTQILPAELETIAVTVNDNGITIRSASGSVIEGCNLSLHWRYPGEEEWRITDAESLYDLKCTAGAVEFSCRFGDIIARVRVCGSGEQRSWQFSGKLISDASQPLELARFCYLVGEVPDDLNFLELLGSREKPVLRKPGDSLPSYRQDVEAFWASMGVKWLRMPDTIHDVSDWAVSKDIAAFLPEWNGSGWGFCFVGPGTAFGEIGYKTTGKPSAFYVGVLLDNLLIDPGEERLLETACVWYGDWQEGFRLWAKTCANHAGVRNAHPALTGYCSWYQFHTKITPEEILQANDEFADWPVGSGNRTIQIDDGFQVAPGDWAPNERFKEIWPDLPGRIAAKGSLPGLWLAPSIIHETHSIAAEHPEWLQRLACGEFAISFANWGGDTYYLDADHPDAQEFMRKNFAAFVAEGWKYFKIDFTYPVSTARQAFDRKKTSFETLRGMYRLFRETCGDEILLSACIGVPGRYALGYADIARLGGDIETSWEAVQTTVRAWITWGCTNGVWWLGDPDVFLMRTENSSLSFEENYLLTGTIGLFGGLFLTSDLPSQWSPEAVAAVKEFWNEHNPRTPVSHRALWDDRGMIQAYRVSVEEGGNLYHAIGVYNWADDVRDMTISLKDVGLQPSLNWNLQATSHSEQMQLIDGVLRVPLLPRHSLRIAKLSLR